MIDNSEKEGHLYFHIKEREDWPPESWLYEDNKGFFLVDIFLFDASLSDEFYFFVQEVS